MHPPSNALDWLAVLTAIVVLLFAWLIYMGRGKRRAKVTFSGFGVSMTIDSAEREAESLDAPSSQAPTTKE